LGRKRALVRGQPPRGFPGGNVAMADLTKMAPAEVAEERATEAHAPYLKVWAALAILTAIEYLYAATFKDFFLILFLGLMVWALIKAGLVGWYFMHLKFEGNWVYALIVPAFVLAAILVFALMPDMSMKPETEEIPDVEASHAVPADRSTGTILSLGTDQARLRAGMS
jgi:cytochrome c oxidase subunit 4